MSAPCFLYGPQSRVFASLLYKYLLKLNAAIKATVAPIKPIVMHINIMVSIWASDSEKLADLWLALKILTMMDSTKRNTAGLAPFLKLRHCQ